MKKEFCKSMSYVLTAALLLGVAIPSSPAAAKKTAPKLSAKKISIKVGQKKTIKVKNTSKKAKWSVKAGKKFVTLSKKKKNSVVVKGKKAGKATVLATIGKKKLTCKVTVTTKTDAKTTPTPPTNTDNGTSAAPTASATAPAGTDVANPSPTPGQSGNQGDATPTPKPTPKPTPTPVAPEFESSEFQYEGLDQKWIDENIDPSKPVVALSFDDGPGGYSSYVDYGTQIQEALKAAGAHATFFYIGAHIEHDAQSRQEVENAWKAGFEVANHSYDSQGLNGVSAETIKTKIAKTDALLSDITGYKNFLFRAPNVAYSNAMFAVIEKPFIDVSIWSQDYQESTKKDDLVRNVTNNLADGGIINMHSVHEKTAQAVPEILEYCKDHGYQVVSVSELFAIKGKKLMTGVKYFNAN